MLIASLAWILISFGVVYRKNKPKHLVFVLSGIFLDIALVLYLEFTKNAIEKAAEFNLPILQQTHVILSTIAFLLYFPLLYVGTSLAWGRKDLRNLHINLALTTYFFRTLGLMFMFSMAK